MNVKEWAAATGVSYVTARRQYAAGTLPVPTYRLGGLIMVGEPLTGASPDAGQVVVEKFLGLLRDLAVTRIVVEHRDRFACFGGEYVEAALTAQGLPEGQPCRRSSCGIFRPCLSGCGYVA